MCWANSGNEAGRTNQTKRLKKRLKYAQAFPRKGQGLNGRGGVGGLGVLEKRLWVAPRNRLKTKDSFGWDCGAVRTPRPTEIGTIRVVRDD